MTGEEWADLRASEEEAAENALIAKYNWGLIPDRMRGGMVRWIHHHIPPGHFLQAVLKNDLIAAVARADDDNQRILSEYVKFLIRNDAIPSACYGSASAFKAWEAKRVI